MRDYLVIKGQLEMMMLRLIFKVMMGEEQVRRLRWGTGWWFWRSSSSAIDLLA